MRPSVLFPLFAPVTTIPGIGPRFAKLLEKIGLTRVVDLLWHLPTGIVDRRYAPKIAEAEAGRVVTLVVRVDKHLPPGNPRLPYKVRCFDDTAWLHLVFFRPKPDYLAAALPVGEVRVISGRIERYRDEIQMTHPDHVGTYEDYGSIATVEPVYGLTAGITPKVMAKAVRTALGRAPTLPEWLDAALVAREGWQAWQPSLAAIHVPADEAALDPQSQPRRRLAYDEMLANQLALALVRARHRRLPGTPIAGDGRLRDQARAALPFTLTVGQEAAIAEIAGDMASDFRMLRLLQGDVGSGKTVVALMAMLDAVEAGFQAAMMAPTEILARQHHATIAPLAARIGVEVALLTGRESARARGAVHEGLAEGRIPIVVGTHALVQEDVVFKALGMVVIDEQHRFGVHQRLALTTKGEGVNVLVMTATPIPRTLMMCAYGDMDVSRLAEKPAGRQPIDTRVAPTERLRDLLDGLDRRLRQGARAYWVCPLVEESEQVDLAAATDRYEALCRRFGADRVGLIHGRQKTAERDLAMARFAAGETRILVATTVIEVGVDVPEATVMIIEHAERFGLAQLHQLRGRVGRGKDASTCVLLYQGPLSDNAKARLEIMRETEDGFRIAEEDLRLRGAGEMLGTRQSGMPAFKLGDPLAHADLIEIARDDAKLMLERDPGLDSVRGQALRTLLYVFERDAAVRLLRSG